MQLIFIIIALGFIHDKPAIAKIVAIKNTAVFSEQLETRKINNIWMIAPVLKKQKRGAL
jgi:hypothetical protein